jgi:osmotically-inducible protein OsmY
MAIAIKSDLEIKQDIIDELDWDPAVDATELGVAVDDGVVILSGWVDSYVTKLAAEAAAQRIDGVRAVANEITVKARGAHTDADIAKMVANVLEANTAVPRERVEVTVKDSEVTLSGEVDTAFQRTAAADSIRYLPGVRDVINLVTILRPSATVTDVKTGIERALVRSAEVDAHRIQVHTEDGHIRLTGTVRSWPEKQEAGLAAWRARGVSHVINEIHVQPW